MKGLLNKNGKLIKFDKGKPVASDAPALFTDDSTLEKIKSVFDLAGIKVELDDLELVPLDVIIETKKTTTYVPVAKN